MTQSIPADESRSRAHAGVRLPWATLSALTLLVGVAAYELHRTRVARAANAVAAPVAARPSASIRAEGRVIVPPGAEITVSAETNGPIRQLTVTEQSSVSAGQLIARIGGDEQQAQLAEARAQLAELSLQVEYTKKERDRTQTLRTANVIPQVELELAAHLYDQAVAKSASLRAGIARLQRTLDKTIVRAPTSGVVTTRLADQGEYVSAGTPLLTIVDLHQMRLEVEVGEFDLGRLSSSAKARIVAEGFDGQSWTGTVLEMPQWVTSRRLKPLDPGRPSDTRVLLVQVSLPEGAPLRLGQRVEVELSVPDSNGAATTAKEAP